MDPFYWWLNHIKEKYLEVFLLKCFLNTNAMKKIIEDAHFCFLLTIELGCLFSKNIKNLQSKEEIIYGLGEEILL